MAVAPSGNAARATRVVSSGMGPIASGCSDMAGLPDHYSQPPRGAGAHYVWSNQTLTPPARNSPAVSLSLDFGPFWGGAGWGTTPARGVPSRLRAGAPHVPLRVRERAAAVAVDAVRGRVHRADVPPRPGPGVRDDPGERAAD